LRLLFGYMYAQPGKKLLFMDGEFGQWAEWHHDKSLDWHLLEHPPHAGLQRWVRDLNAMYRAEPALHELDFDPQGFGWIDSADWEQSVISLIRRGRSKDRLVLGIFNFTPVPRLTTGWAFRGEVSGGRSSTAMLESTGGVPSGISAGSARSQYPLTVARIL
jgi:1,4-alpha-glucan branching enzyme